MSTPALQLGWVIVYVPDPDAALALYEAAFGAQRSFLTPDGSYGQLDTGATTLAFASDELAASNLPDGFERLGPDRRPSNIELCFVSADVDGALATAIAAGCTLLAEPKFKPQGQTVAYVRDPWGTLIELATPLG